MNENNYPENEDPGPIQIQTISLAGEDPNNTASPGPTDLFSWEMWGRPPPLTPPPGVPDRLNIASVLLLINSIICILISLLFVFAGVIFLYEGEIKESVPAEGEISTSSFSLGLALVMLLFVIPQALGAWNAYKHKEFSWSLFGSGMAIISLFIFPVLGALAMYFIFQSRIYFKKQRK